MSKVSNNQKEMILKIFGVDAVFSNTVLPEGLLVYLNPKIALSSETYKTLIAYCDKRKLEFVSVAKHYGTLPTIEVSFFPIGKPF